jgi:iron complex transport system substrate-binding protein
VKGNGITMALHRSARLPLVLLASLALSACASADAPPSTDAPPSAGVASASPVADSPVASASAAPAFPVTVTDDTGRDVEIAEPPDRIVSLAPSNTELVCALGACDRLVGVTDFDDYPEEVTDVPDVVIAAQVDVELVVGAEPDLVLAAGNELTPTPVIEQLEELGLTILVLYPESLDEVADNVRLLGSVLDADDAADEIATEMEDRVAEVVAAVDGAERPRTLYEVFHAEGVTYTAGDGSFLASMLELAGAEPVVGDAQGTLAAEALVAADPELVLLGTASYDPSLADPDAALAAVSSRPGWADLTAVRDGRVQPYLDDIVTTRPGPRIVEGLEALARAIHPDRFD